MLIEPSLETISPAYEQGRAQVVWTRMVADLETPVSAMLKLSAGKSNTFLLESVEGGAVRGRYSIIGIEPDLLFRAVGDRAEINTTPATDPEAYAPLEGLTKVRMIAIARDLADVVDTQVGLG